MAHRTLNPHFKAMFTVKNFALAICLQLKVADIYSNMFTGIKVKIFNDISGKFSLKTSILKNL